MAGFVANRPDLALPRAEYDVAIIGAGLIGLATAQALAVREPATTTLIVEQGGIPSEEGASQYSPAIHHALFADAGLRARARRWRSVLERATAEDARHGRIFEACGVVSFEPEHVALARQHPSEFELLSAAVVRARWPLTETFLDLTGERVAAFDVGGGFGNAEALAYRFGTGAVRAGADLCLNARASWDADGRILLDRLTINNRMELEVAAQTRVQARRLVIAAGSVSASLIEQHCGEMLPLGQCLMQFPRIEHDPAWPLTPLRQLDLPVLLDAGFAFRPHLDGVLVIPPLLAPDPAGYVAVGGRFLGVQVGLRREHLAQFSAVLDRLPALSLPTLNPGRTPLNLRRAAEVLTPGGVPVHWPIPASPHSVVVGGWNAFALGPGEVAEKEAGSRIKDEGKTASSARSDLPP